MSRTPSPRTRTAPARLLALAAPSLLLLLASPGVGAAAAAPAGCGVRVLTADRTDGRTGLLVTAPPAPAQLAPTAGDFHLVQGSTSQRPTVAAVAASDVSVAVVLATTARTTAESFRVARDGALELLVGLPPQAQAAVLSSGRPTPLAALSSTRAAATRSLSTARAGAGDSGAAAAMRGAAVLPAGGHVVLLSDGTGDGTPAEQAALTRTLRQRGLALDRVHYPATATAAPVPACATPQDPVLTQVDQVTEAVTHQYRVQAVLDPSRPATLTVDRVGATAVPVAAQGAAAPANAYPDTRLPAGQTRTWYAAAAVVGLLGLLLLQHRRHGDGPPVGPPLEQHDDLRTPAGTVSR